MPKHTPDDATRQVSGRAAQVVRAVRRHLIGIAVGGSIAAALVAPFVSLAAAPQLQIVHHAAAHSLLMTDGPSIWGCGGSPGPC